MTRFYQPDLSTDLDSPFIRDGKDKLIRRSYWLDMDDRTLVMVMVNGIGANLTNEQKRAHLTDLRREHLIDQVCIQEILAGCVQRGELFLSFQGRSGNEIVEGRELRFMMPLHVCPRNPPRRRQGPARAHR